MLKNIFITIVRLITAPQDAWRDLSNEIDKQKNFQDKYLYPIVGIVALTSFIGGLWFTRDGNLQIALKNAIVSAVTVFAGYYIASFILNEIAPRFGLLKNQEHFQRFVGYSSALLYALYIVLPLLFDFFVLWFFAFYTAYIVYVGAQIYIETKEEKRTNFTITATILVLLIPMLINSILTFLIK